MPNYIEYELNGELFDVNIESPEGLDWLMNNQNAKRTDDKDQGKTNGDATDANATSTTAASNQGTDPSNNNQEENTESESGAGSSESQVNFITHPEEYEFNNAARQQFGFRQEENLVPFLNERYKDTNVNFAQANIGEDAIEVLIGNQKSGEGKIFPFNVKHEGDSGGVYDRMKMYIDRSTNKEYDEAVRNELSTRVTLDDIYTNDTPQNRAAFANHLDDLQGLNDEIGNLKTFKNRLSNKTDGLAATTLEVLSFGHYENLEADMSGNIALSDGSIVAYEDLWDQREDLRDVLIKRENDQEYNDKINLYGSDEGLDEHIENNAPAYFGTEDKRISNINKSIENITAGKMLVDGKLVDVTEDNEDTANKELERLKKEKQDLITKLGYEELYDAEGNFIEITKKDPITGEDGEINYISEAEAEQLAGMHDIDYLKEERRNAYINLITLAKAANRNIGQVEEGTNAIIGTLGDIFDVSGDSLDNDTRQLQRVSESGDIFNLGGELKTYSRARYGQSDITVRDDQDALTDLPGDSPIARDFNEALLKFKTLSRAVDLNVDISQTKQESFGKEFIDDLSIAFTGAANPFAESNFTEDMAVEAFEHTIGEMGYELPDFEGWSRRGSNSRYAAEAASGVVTDMGPLLTELWAFKKVGGLKKIQQTVGGLASKLTSGKNVSKIYKGMVNNVVVPAVIPMAEWSSAELIGENLMGWKSQTIDTETGETRLMFPAVMGISGKAYGALRNGIRNKLIESPSGWIYARLANSAPETIAKINQAVGQGATATGLLTVSESAQAIGDALIKEGKLPDAEKWKEITDVEHLLTTFAGMTILGSRSLPGKLREAIRKDVLALNKNTIKSKEAAKFLGAKDRNKDGTYVEPEKLVQDKIKQIKKDKSLSAEQKEVQIKEAVNKGKDLQTHNEVIHMQKAAKSQGEYNKYLQDRYIIANKFKTGKWTSKDRDKLAELTPEEFEGFLESEGLKEGDSLNSYYRGVYNIVKHGTNVANRAGLTKGSKARETYVENLLEAQINSHRIESLKEEVREDKTKKVTNEAEIKRLEERNKELTEKTKESLDQFDVEFKKLMDAELAQSKVMAKELGAEFNVLGDNMFKKALAKHGKSKEGEFAEGFIVGDQIYINRDRALRTKNLGVGVHEVTHRLLKDSLKETYTDKNGVKRKRMSKDGMKIIDSMLSKLSTKERKIVEDRINEDYKFDAEGKERDPRDYYEEYITVLGDAIKNEQISRDPSTAKKLGKIFYPIIGKVFPNLYKFDINGTNSKKAGQDLFDMLQEIQSEGLTGRVKEGVGKGDAKSEFAKSQSRDGFANEKIAEDLGLKSKTAEIVKENERLYEKVVENAKEKGIPVNKEAVTQRVKDALIMNNMARVTALAKKAAEAGERTGLEEGLRKGFEDFQSEYTMQLVELANTWNPARNKSFGAYMNSLLPLRYGNILSKLKGKSLETKSLTDESTAKKAGKVEGGVKSSKEKLLETRSKFKKFILDRTEKSDKGLPKEQLAGKIKNAAQGALRTAGDVKATVKNKPRLFLSNVEKSLENSLFKSFKNALGTRGTYKDVINNSFHIIQHTARTVRGRYHMNKAGMDFALKPVINPKTGKQERMTTKEANDNGLPLNKDGSGPGKWQIDTKNFNEANYKSWANAEGMSGSAFGTRKDGLSRILSIETGKDAIPSQLKDPHQQVFDFDGKPIPGRFVNVLEGLSLQQKNKISAEALVAEVSNIIDRSPGLMFSNNKKVREFEKLQENLDISTRIENLRKPENAEILKVYNKADINGDFIESLRQIEIDNFVKHSLINLREMEAEAILSGKEIKDRIDLNEIAVTNSQMKSIIKEFNERTKSNITYDKQDFARDPKKFEAYKREMAETFERFPEEFLNNDKVLNILINSIGQGNLNVGVRVKPDGSKRKQVWLKPSGNESFMITELGKKPKGIKEKVPTIKDTNGKERSILDAVKITDSGKFKKDLRKFYDTHGSKSNYQQLLNEWASKKLSAKEFTWEQTDAANKYLREKFIEAAVKNVFEATTPAEFQRKADAFHKLFQIQTNINSGVMKGTNTMRYISMEAPTKSPTGERMASGMSGYHAEHAFFNLAHNATVSNLLAKHKKSMDAKAFMEDYRKLSPKLQQYVITESHRQRNEGTQADGTTLGNTEFFEGGHRDPMLNVLTRDPKKAWTILDLKTGQTIGAGISKNLKLGSKEAQTTTSMLGDVAFMFKNKPAGVKFEAKVDKTLSDASLFSKSKVKDTALRDKLEALKIVDRAFELGRKKNKENQGISVFDFDETVGVSDNYVIATKGKETKKISSADWPFLGEKMVKEGWSMDFSDFNRVTDGRPGPLMQKMKNRIKKYGPKDVFILTARAHESQKAIHDYLKSEGIDIPIENITGLGNSTGEAKAMWMMEKFSKGYNDFYFVDDALPNVKAVKKVLDQLDVKSNVQQALFSNNKSKAVNDIMEHSLNIDANKTFSKAEAKVRGANIKRRRMFMTDSAADLELLLEPLYGKGKDGIKNKEWFVENFIKPFERGHNDLNNAKQKAANEYLSLRKQNKDIVKSLDKEVGNTGFTTDMAVRVYNWNKNGIKIPDLAKATEKKLVEHVKSNPELQAFAENAARIVEVREPSNSWWAETIAGEIGGLGEGVSRKKHLADWIEAKNEIFSEANLNKMESKLGSNWRKNVEEMLERMETGKTRRADLGSIGNRIMDYLNGSVGTIMNFNTRSAVLQLLSTVNFVNHSFNNPIAAAKAFANQPQYWKDFMKIMNSDMLKQRRAGLQINVTEAELAAAAAGSKNPARAVMARILKAGYIPTKIADSFAIASGGATYYRNAIKKYIKEGMSKEAAEKQAWIDFQAIAERTQQSSRPDLLSAQQVSWGGRVILPFANTPMQMNRIKFKELLDIKNGRYEPGLVGQNTLSNKISKIAYYGFVQSAIFAGLQSGLFALMAFSDDDQLKAEKETYAINTMADSFLRGMGIQGAVLASVKNALLEFQKQNNKSYGADFSEVAEKLLNVSPTIGSKFGKLDAAGNTYMYNKKEILEKGLTLDSPALTAVTMATEALFNAPTNRGERKIDNIKVALDEQNEWWQRVLAFGGWSKWDSGVGQREKAEEKAEKEEQKRIDKEYKKIEDQKKKEEEKKQEEERKKKEGIKQVRCSGVKSNGERCSIMIETKASRAKCTYHKSYKSNESTDRNNNGVKEYQCTANTSSGRRCRNRTENTNKKCYAHQ